MLAVTSENVGVVLAFGGGIISILSPCVLPMVPGYLSVVTGFSIAELDEGGRERLRRVAVMTALFTLGFGTVFTVLGLAASEIGQAAFDNQATLTRVSGAIIIVMALYLAGSQLITAPRLYPEKRFVVDPPLRLGDRADHGRRVRVRLVAVPRAGARCGLRRRGHADVGARGRAPRRVLDRHGGVVPRGRASPSGRRRARSASSVGTFA